MRKSNFIPPDDSEAVDPSKLRGFLGFVYDGGGDVFPDQLVPLARVYFDHLQRSGCKAKPYPASAEAEEMQRFRKLLCDGLLPVLVFTGLGPPDPVRPEMWADEENFHRALKGWHLIDNGSKRAVFVCARTSVDLWLGQATADEEQQPKRQLSPYLTVMLRVAGRLDISRTQPGKKEFVETEIKKEWASTFPNEEELSGINVSKMSALIRWPTASRGKGDPNNVARKKRPSRS